MIEEWKPVKQYEGTYEVSNLGRVRSVDRFDTNGHHLRSVVLKPHYNKKGYARVCLSVGNCSRYMQIHRLVALAFIPNPLNLPVVNHKDECPSNNNVTNLEWCTTEYNVNYGTGLQRRSNNPRWQKATLVNLSKASKVAHAKARKQVIATNAEGKSTAFESVRCAAKALDITSSNISRCCNNIRKSAGGYNFSFA
ncbi:NUMOD4 domain-containing protein [Lacticaseibacillus pantheris]|jgi:hypothetical protein